MKMQKRHIALLMLIAFALSLVINFSYLLLPIITERGMSQRGGDDHQQGEHSSGVLHITDDLYGYIVCDCEKRDSVYVSSWQINTYQLQEGDRLQFRSHHPRSDHYSKQMIEKAHKRLDEIVMRNGEKFDFDALYDRPSRTVEFVPFDVPKDKLKGYYFDYSRIYWNKPDDYTFKRERTWQINNLKPREYK